MKTQINNLYDPRDDLLAELSETIKALSEENAFLKDQISIGQFNAPGIEIIDVKTRIAELKERIRILKIDNQALIDSRNYFQHQTVEVMKSRNYWEKLAKRQKTLLNGGPNA
jgi:flagellar hook-associated protein FlgK